MGKLILKLLPPGTPKKVRLPLLRELHPAHAMDLRNQKAYISVLLGVLPEELDDQVLKKAYLPTVRRLGSEMRSQMDSAFWKIRQLTKDRDLAEQQKFGKKIYKSYSIESEGETLEWEVEIFKTDAERALKKYKSDLSYKRREKGIKALPTGGAWLTGKPKKAILFLDCACVLRNTGLPAFDSLIDDVAQELEIHPAIVELVKAYVGVPDDCDLYHKACADITALVKPAPVKKKTVAQKAAARKAAAKKAALKKPIILLSASWLPHKQL